MLLLLLLCITAYSTPIKSKSLELSKLTNAQSKLETLLERNSFSRDYIKHKNEIEYILSANTKKEQERKLSLIDLEPLKKKSKNNDIELAFNDEATDLLHKLTNVLEDVNQNLAQNKKRRQTKSKEIYVIKMNEDQRYARHKRDTDSATIPEVKNDTVIPEAVSAKPTEKENSTTETNTIINENTTNVTTTEVNTCNQTVNSRRSFYTDESDISKEVKTRLLSYISEYFNDITAKTDSLRDIKRTFASNDEYSIGYIIANIDTLGINLHNLKADIDMNHEEWSEKEILDMFDKIKMSHGVVTSLLNALKTIMNRPLVKDAKGSQYLHLV